MRGGLVSVIREDAGTNVYEGDRDACRQHYDAKLTLYRAKFAATPPALIIALEEPALDFICGIGMHCSPTPIYSGSWTSAPSTRASTQPASPGVAVKVGHKPRSNGAETVPDAARGRRRRVSAFDRTWIAVVGTTCARSVEASFTYLTDGPYEKLLADVARSVTFYRARVVRVDNPRRRWRAAVPPLLVVESLRRVAQVPI